MEILGFFEDTFLFIFTKKFLSLLNLLHDLTEKFITRFNGKTDEADWGKEKTLVISL